MINILIADDHAIIRKGLIQLLTEAFSDAKITEVGNGIELLRKVRDNKYNIVISDLSMPGRSGLESLKQLKEEFPKLSVLILSMHPEDQYALRVLKAGASGYLCKESASEELVNAVRIILGGRKYISQAVAEKLAENIGQDPNKAIHEALSDREYEVLKLIAKGNTVSEISEILSLSLTTISTYRSRILSKMNLRTNAELTYYAIDNKLV